MRTRDVILAAIIGVAITVITGLIDHTPPNVVGASHYGYPFHWLSRLIIAPQYFPWAVNTGNLVIDIVLWSILAGIVLILLKRKR